MQKFSFFSKDGAIVQSYANHIAHLIDQHRKAAKQQLEIIFQVCKKVVLLKEEILPHYQNS